MLDSIDFKNAMAVLASAVSVVTTQGAAGRFGLTASAVCSVTDSPPSLLVCVNRSANSHAQFLQNNVFAVNVLPAGAETISNAFASGLTPEERFASAEWVQLVTGSPILKEALVSFDCEISQVQTVGSHDIIVGKIVAIRQNATSQALVYFDRRYHHVG
jgi:flavin reductase